jgi:hypothetical protein
MLTRGAALVTIISCCLSLATYKAASEDQTAEVHGRVVNLWGVPLAKAELSFFKLDQWPVPGVPSTEKLLRTVTADEEGHYRVRNLPWGLYNVHVTRGEYCCADILQLYLAKGTEQVLDVGIPMALENGLTPIIVIGKVYGEGQGPISDASITIVSAHNPQWWNQKRTGADGTYKFHLYQPGQYIIYASKPGFIVGSATVDLGRGGSERIDIQIRPGRGKGLDLD